MDKNKEEIEIKLNQLTNALAEVNSLYLTLIDSDKFNHDDYHYSLAKAVRLESNIHDYLRKRI